MWTAWLETALKHPIISGVVVVAITGLFAFLFVRFFSERVRRYIAFWFISAPPGTHFTILVANIHGDEGFRQTDRIAAALSVEQGGVHVIKVGRSLSPPGVGDVTRGQQRNEAKARSWLGKKRGDLLIWGLVAGERLRLWLVSSEKTTTGLYGFSGEGEFELPADFNEDFAAALVSLALSRVSPATEEAGRYLADVLQPVAEKLQHLLARPPPGLDPEQKGTLNHALGLAASVTGEQSGRNDWLKTAINAYRQVLKEYTRERVPLQWAMTQNNLGNALARLGARESGIARLEEAVAAYRRALEVQTREQVPLDWAMTQNNLGSALTRLGEREAGTARLEEAVAAYRQALEEYTRERVPLDWAMSQNNLGNALSKLGERESGTDRLEEAVAAYRQALEEYTRERVPLEWGATQNNLGAALASLGERESGTGRLEESVAAYRQALEVRTRERVPLDWASTQNNLGAALANLGERVPGTVRLEESVAAFRQALEEYTRERVPLDWATTQNNLGAALMRMGEREPGTVRLEEAVAAHRQALEIFQAAEAEYYLRGVEENIAGVEAILSQRRP